MIFTLASVSIYIADKMVSQLIKDEGYGGLKSFLFPKAKYKSCLELIISETIEEFSLKYPIENTATQFPFYKSQILLDLLNQHILYKTNNSPLLVEEFKKNKNIIVPDTNQLSVFYKIFIDKVNSNKILKKLHFDESYINEIFNISDSFKELLTTSTLILDKVNLIDQKLGSSNILIEALRNRFPETLAIHGLYNSRRFVSHIKSEKSSNREKVIENLLLDFHDKVYVHIHGNISMGKTQLAVLLCEKFENKFWIELKDINAKAVVEVILKELSNYFECEINNQGDLEKIVALFPNNTILVFDDLPKFDLPHRDLELFMSLFELLKKSGVKILSTSNFPLPNRFIDFLKSDDFIERLVPFLSEDEIQEVLVAYGATDKIAELMKSTIHSTSCGHPAIVNAICRYLLNENWKLDNANLEKIFFGNFASNLDEVTFEQIFKTISDNQSKELLYRLKLIIGYISDKEISCISLIIPVIKYPFENVTVLSGLWLQKIKPDLYEISPLIKRLNSKNISPVLFEKINHSLGELILSEKKIDQVSANKAIIYFMNSKSNDRAGFILSLVLQESLKNPDLFFNWGFDLFWTSTSFPEPMDLYLQSVLRFFQIRIYMQRKKNIDFLVTDLENIITKASKKNINLTHVSFFLSYIFLETNPEKSNKYLLLGLKDFEISKSIDKEGTLSKLSIESLIWCNLTKISTQEEFDSWLLSLSQLSAEQISNSLIGELSKFSCFIFCSRLYDDFDSLINENWDDLLIFYQTIINKTESYNVNILVAYCLKYQIRCLCTKIGDYSRAEELFDHFIPNFSNDPLSAFVIHDELGRQLFYLGHKEKALKYLLKASTIEVPKIFTEKIDTYLTLNEIFGLSDCKEAHKYILKAFDFQNENEFVDELLSSKVIGELSISTWELDNSKDVFYIIEKGIEKLLFSYKPFKEYQATIIRYGHILNFYYHKIANRSLNDIDNSPYTIPFRSFFLKNNDLLLENGYYFEQRKFMLAYLMTQAFEEINDKELASKWAFICFKLNKEEIPNPLISLMNGLNIYLILDGKFEESVILEIEILKSIDDLHSAEKNQNEIVNTLLVQMIKNRPDITFDPFDDLIFERVINFIVIKSLWDYLLTQDHSVILRLENNLDNINLYFSDKEPLEIIKKACSLLLLDEQNSTSIISLANSNHKLNAPITLLLYLFASYKTPIKEALLLHLSLCQRLEMISTNIATNSVAYKFLVIPFLLDFWKKNISNNKSAFFDYDFLKSKGIPKVHSTKILTRPKALFEILSYHLEVEPRDSERIWFENK